MFVSKRFNLSNYMGLIHTDIELISTEDMMLARRGEMDSDDIRRMNVNMLVDTGSFYLVINENIQEYMQYPFIRRIRGEPANGKDQKYDLVGPVSFKFRGVLTSTEAAVMPGNSRPLLGAHALESLDLIIHPSSLTLEFSGELRKI